MRPAGRNAAARARTQARPLLAIAGCVAGFGAVAVDITHGGLLARADPHVAHWSFRHIPGWLHTLLEGLTQLGDSALLAVVVVLASAWLATRQRRLDALLLVAAGATTALLTTGLKEAFRRSRPIYVDRVHGPHSFSFPSGHSSGAFTVYVLAALLLTVGAPRRRRARLTGSALALAALVAATRVLLPVHYLSDAIAGSLVGLAVVAAALLARAAIPPRR